MKEPFSKEPLSELNKNIYILVADDEPEVRHKWCNLLNNNGYQTYEASNTDEILSQLDKVHILLLDYYIPGEPTGEQLLKKIKDDRGNKLDILVITGMSGYESKRNIIKAGATAYFVKMEFDDDDLMVWIRQITYRIWLEGILNAMPDELIVLGRDGRILWANEAKKRMFGNDIVGKECNGHLEIREERNPNDSRFCLGCPSKLSMDRKETIRTEWEYMHATKKQKMWIELSVAPVLDPRGEVIAAAELGRDITLKRIMSNHLSEIRSQRDWKHMLNLFLNGFEKLGVPHARLYLRDGNSFRIIDSRGLDKTDIKDLEIEKDPPTKKLQEIQKPMLIRLDEQNTYRDLEPDNTVNYLWHEGINKRIFPIEGMKEWLELPLLVPDDRRPKKLVLFGKVSTNKFEPFTAYDIQLLGDYVQQCGNLINNARKQEELKLLYDMRKALLDLEQEIFTIHDKKVLLNRVVKRVCEIIGARICSIFEWDEKLQILIIASSFVKNTDGKEIEEMELPEEKYEKKQCLTGHFFNDWLESRKQRSVYISSNIKSDLMKRGFSQPDAINEYESLIGEPIVNSIFASLGTPGQPLGVLRTINKVNPNEFGERKFSSHDKELFEAAAAQIALAINNLRLLDRYAQARRDREDYLRILAHQLRTPITDVMLIADNMQKPEFPKRNFRENINTIQLHTRYFDKIIRNFEIVADRANPPELKLQPVKLQTIINRCLQLLTIVNRTILPDNFILLPKIKGDEDRIEQVFVSLLDNARKYSTNESGKIHIKCGYTDNMVSVSIINEGPFINEADRERIIKLGERTEEARSITTTGSGIGLTAVTIVMDQHRGKLEISSTPIDDKAENTFTVIFPREG